jgi:hypothetical protein
MRKVKELNEAIAHLKRLQSSEGSQLVHDREFRKAIQTLERAAESDTVSRRQLVRAVSSVARVLCDRHLRRDETR